jgi:hypothetical protein
MAYEQGEGQCVGATDERSLLSVLHLLLDLIWLCSVDFSNPLSHQGRRMEPPSFADSEGIEDA